MDDLLNEVPESAPLVVKFAYRDFVVTQFKVRGKCKMCGVEINETKGTTSGFTRHLRNKHPTQYKVYVESKALITTGSKCSFPVIEHSLSPVINSKIKHEAINESIPKLQNSLTISIIHHLIVGCGLPLSLVEDDNFHKFMADLAPNYVMPKYDTILNDVLPWMCKDKMSKCKKILSDSSNVALTINVLKDYRGHNFLVMMASTFDVINDLQMKLIYFKSLDIDYHMQHIFKAINEVLDDYDLQDKVQYILSDDIELDTNLIEIRYKVYYILTCFARTLKSIMEERLEGIISSNNDLFTSKYTKLLEWLKKKPSFKQLLENSSLLNPSTQCFEDIQLYHRLSLLSKLGRDKFIDIFTETNNDDLILTNHELQQLTELSSIIEPFIDAIQLVSTDDCVTISNVLPIIIRLIKKLTDFSMSIEIYSQLVEELQLDLMDRFSHRLNYLSIFNGTNFSKELDFGSDIYLASCVLDPIHAYNWIDNCQLQSIDKEAFKNIIYGKLISLLRIVSDQSTDSKPTSKTQQSEGLQNVEGVPDIKRQRLSSFFGYKQHSTEQPSTEMAITHLSRYIETINRPEFDCEKNSTIYKQPEFEKLWPLLSMLWCVPATSSVMQNWCSQFEHIIRSHCDRLNDSQLGSLIFLKGQK